MSPNRHWRCPVPDCEERLYDSVALVDAALERHARDHGGVLPDGGELAQLRAVVVQDWLQAHLATHPQQDVQRLVDQSMTSGEGTALRYGARDTA